jgi:ABC-2 type transport system ATP-binding protein
LLHRPKLIILDEPLSGLDPIGRKELKDIITQVNKKGVTVFFSSHIISDVEEVCSEVIFLEKGKLVFNGEVQKIINEHLKMESIVRYIKEGKVLTHKVADNEKRNFIESLIKNNFELVSVTPEKPTLEEIFYKVKSS